MYDFSSPTEILEIIIEGFISEYAEIRPRDPEWPKLRSIRVEDFLNDEAGDDPISFDTSQASRCCLDLTEIVITGAALHSSELKLIRAMCSRDVAKLAVLL